MSKIWDSLQAVEQHGNKEACENAIHTRREPIAERRSSKRLGVCAPVLVYGYEASGDPFHEGTEGLYVNARGGLITLRTAVNPGQTLLLINRANEKEQKCTVVRQTSAYLNRIAIVVQFSHPAPDFWDTTQLLK